MKVVNWVLLTLAVIILSTYIFNIWSAWLGIGIAAGYGYWGLSKLFNEYGA